MPSTAPDSSKTKINLKFNLDLRLVIAVLVVTVVAMLFIWKPWSATSPGDRTVEVSGEATVKATPDEFVFYPTYQFTNADKDAALAAMSAKSDEITNQLKKLGVNNKDIKTNSSGYDTPVYYSMPSGGSKDSTYTLQMTVTVDNEKLAQKVQDYLLTTTPTGSVSPQPTFSEPRRKALESKARDLATKEARAKAEQMAKNLGFRVGKVKTISDGSSNFGITPLYARGSMVAEDTKAQSLAVQPGENELPYSITVVYYIK